MGKIADFRVRWEENYVAPVAEPEAPPVEATDVIDVMFFLPGMADEEVAPEPVVEEVAPEPDPVVEEVAAEPVAAAEEKPKAARKRKSSKK